MRTHRSLPTPPTSDPRDTGVGRAHPDDLGFIDHLQWAHAKQLGFLPRRALEEAVRNGDVWLARESGEPAGYIYGRPRYMRCAEIGVIFQAAISYDARRRLLGTALVEAWAASLPPATKQVLLWCAQDIEANRFWASLGFTALGYRAGSTARGRVHILWSRVTATAPADWKLWTPSQTRGGLLRASRAVTPLEPGQVWSDRVTVPPASV